MNLLKCMLVKLAFSPLAWLHGYRYVIDRDDEGGWRCYPVPNGRNTEVTE